MAAIQSVIPKADYTLEIILTNHSRLICNMKPYIETVQFCPLKDMETWKNVETKENCLSFTGVTRVEIPIDTLLDLFMRELNVNCNSAIEKAEITQEWLLHIILKNKNQMDLDFQQLLAYPLFSPLIEKGLFQTIKAQKHSLLWKNENVALEISMHTLLRYFS
jgi:hypothetical protein